MRVPFVQRGMQYPIRRHEDAVVQVILHEQLDGVGRPLGLGPVRYCPQISREICVYSFRRTRGDHGSDPGRTVRRLPFLKSLDGGGHQMRLLDSVPCWQPSAVSRYLQERVWSANAVGLSEANFDLNVNKGYLHVRSLGRICDQSDILKGDLCSREARHL